MKTNIKGPGPEKIDKFRNQAKHFWELAEKTRANAPRVPHQWQPEYERLNARASDIRTKIEGTTTAIDAAYRHGQQVYGQDKEGLDNLGILPLIPWAIISAGGAAMAYFANDAITFNEKVDELERLQELGYTQEEALAILEKPSTSQRAQNFFLTAWQHPLGKAAYIGGAFWAFTKLNQKYNWI